MKEKFLKIQKFFNYFLTALVLLLACMLMFITVKTVRGEPVVVSGYCVMQIVTGSMEPSIHVGDCVLVQQVPSESLRERDIIAYVSEVQDISGLTVMHRIIEILPDGSFMVRGDANPLPDELPVRADQIRGKFIRKLPFFSWLTSFTNIRKILLLFVMCVTTVTAFYEVRTISTVSKEIRTETEEERRERLIREAIDREKEKLAQKFQNQDGDDT